MICSGCSYAPVYDNQGNKVDDDKQNKCPFCRTPACNTEEMMKRLQKRVDAEDPVGIHNLGIFYRDGKHGLPQDHAKALENWHRAAELGHAAAYCNIGNAYYDERGVRRDMKKTKHYYELAAVGGDVFGRYNLGNNEANAGNMNRALKHYMIAVEGGYAGSLKSIKELYSHGYATKDDYTKALQLYQEYLGEIKSDQRDKAAAAREDYRYY